MAASLTTNSPASCLTDAGCANAAPLAMGRHRATRTSRSRRVRRGGPSVATTAAAEGPPRLTRREREVLVALCRPMASGAAFAQPASVKQLAGEFVVSEAAIKAHLSRLYDKF